MPQIAVDSKHHLIVDHEVLNHPTDQNELHDMAKKAKETGTGARALRMIAESLLRDLMFEVPSDPTIKEIVIDKDSIVDRAPPKVVRDRSA